MKRAVTALSVTIIALAAAACGQTIEQRAATGAIAGAVVAGPVGAAVGARRACVRCARPRNPTLHRRARGANGGREGGTSSWLK